MKKEKLIGELTQKDLKNIKLIAFDVDGVLVPRGTNIRQVGNVTRLETKRILPEQVEQIKKLHALGFEITINSGRGLYLLQDMFREVLPFISLTYENGSATWYRGKIYQHVNSFKFLHNVYADLAAVRSKYIKGFEQKEFIITVHCTRRVKRIEQIVSNHKNLYTIWNGEAYDIGLRGVQQKSVGLKSFMKSLKLTKKNVLAIGDNYNDQDLLSSAGIRVSADKTRLKGDFYIDLDRKNLPAKQLMGQIIRVCS